jgi:hypothetical protein
MSVTTINSEGAFDATVRKQINANFASLLSTNEAATATPAADAIPQAGSDGKLDAGWIPDLSATYQPAGNYAEVVSAPASADATGTPGQIAFADGVLYICIATDTWQKVTIATWT